MHNEEPTDEQKRDLALDLINSVRNSIINGEVNEVFIVAGIVNETHATMYSGNWRNLAIAGAALQTEFTVETMRLENNMELN